ncbi:hypothetical protein [Aquimarina sp. Aq78]|uniref:hypothetical protein n=1 Tax=Aquimarina sp. Aq78 TaxID=1191889 RepID=UPI000D112274|nr:hypothetical protein [Aquimarina sp. Aq78]
MKNLEYNGNCAFAVSTGKIATKASGKYVLTKNGKHYAFSNSIAKFLFKLLPNRIEKANTAWNSKDV